MLRQFAIIAAATFMFGCQQAPADAQLNERSREEVGEIVRAYILAHPEIIEEALIKLSAKQQAAASQEAQKAIASNFDAIYNNENDYFIGPADAEITVVEFFDYRCGFCKRSLDWTTALPEVHDGKVRVVFKEFPILSPESEQAALAALAAGEQGLYAEMHAELMNLDNSSGFEPDDIDAAAERAGVDVAQMREDMKLVRLQKVIADNKSLARKLGVNGTPAFFVGETMIEGANQPGVDQAIEDALAEVG